MNTTEKAGYLLDIPKTLRDSDWTRQFFEVVVDARFVWQSEPIRGPDQFLYMAVRRRLCPEEKVSSIAANLDTLLYRWTGVAIEPEGDGAAFVLSYGDLATYKLFGRFENPNGPPPEGEGQEPTVMEVEAETVLVGQPNEEYLPGFLRAALGAMIQSVGYADPRVLLVQTPDAVRSLAFNLGPYTPEHEGRVREVVRRIQWCLPRGYSMIYGHDESFPFVNAARLALSAESS